MTATLVHTSSREADARLAMARVAAARRVQQARISEEAKQAKLRKELAHAARQGQYLSEDGRAAFCFICSRATDHLGEHSPEQIKAWQRGK